MSNTRPLEGKVAVVTGASRGIGACIARTLADDGAIVALVARNQNDLQIVQRQIVEKGNRANIHVCDVTSASAVEELHCLIRAELGTVHILVNGAGVFGPIRPVSQSAPKDWINTLMVNAIGPYLTCRFFLEDMISCGWGRIVNVTSAAALHTPGPLNSAYGSSKAALNQFTRHLAAEVAGTGVTANVIHPGEVKTDMWTYIREEIDKTGSAGHGYREWAAWVERTGGDPPEKSAKLILRLVSDDAASINGQFLWIENGLQPPSHSW